NTLLIHGIANRLNKTAPHDRVMERRLEKLEDYLLLNADESWVGLPDLTELDRLSWLWCVNLLVTTGVDCDVSGGPDQVTWLSIGTGNNRSNLALCTRGTRQVHAELPVHV